jgi:demethylmenaquinone methyltransferase / 2-methoxy-6-polyprenyl-1,4-benzoquinol methylase
MVRGLGLKQGSRVLDVASGTGSIARLLEASGMKVIALDQSEQMLGQQTGRPLVMARGEQLPFAEDQFDGLTFGYLLRYVDDVVDCLRELGRVVRPGGMVGMVEFGRPRGMWGPLWSAYTRAVLPAAGRLIASGWGNVGSFLGPSIDDFHRTYPEDRLRRCWEEAGLEKVRVRHLSGRGGLVMWAQKS